MKKISTVIGAFVFIAVGLIATPISTGEPSDPQDARQAPPAVAIKAPEGPTQAEKDAWITAWWLGESERLRKIEEQNFIRWIETSKKIESQRQAEAQRRSEEKRRAESQRRSSPESVRVDHQEPSSGRCGGSLPPCYVMKRESGGSLTAQNPHSSASGKWQFIRGTWGGYGGYAEAYLAPESVQDAKARELWAGGRGCSHWSAC